MNYAQLFLINIPEFSVFSLGVQDLFAPASCVHVPALIFYLSPFSVSFVATYFYDL